MSRARVALRWLRRVVGAASLLLVFCVTGALAVVLHLPLGASRRLAARTVESSLDSALAGQFSVGSITRLDRLGLDVADLEVRDPRGRRVLKLTGVRARADLLDLARRALAGAERETLPIGGLAAEEVEVELLTGSNNTTPGIASAFVPRASSGSPSTKEGGGLGVYLREVQIGRGTVRGTLPDGKAAELEVAGLVGSVLVTPSGVTRIDVRRFGFVGRGVLPMPLRGTGQLELRLPGSVRVSASVFAGALELDADLRLRGKELFARLATPHATPEAVKALWGPWPLRTAASGSVVVEGRLPQLKVRAEAAADDGTVSANGPLVLEPEPNLALTVDVRRLDLRALGVDTAPTAIAADLLARGWWSADQPFLELNGLVYAFDAANVRVPPVDLIANLGPDGLQGTVTPHEPGLPVRFDVVRSRDGELDVRVRSKGVYLEKIPRLERATGLRGRVAFESNVKLVGAHLTAALTANSLGLNRGAFGASSARIAATLDGPASEPWELEIGARVDGQQLKLASQNAAQFGLDVSGTLGRPRFLLRLGGGSLPNATLDSRVDVRGGGVVEGTVLKLERGGATLEAGLDRLTSRGGGLELHGLRLRGEAGTASANLRIGENEVSGRAQGHAVDLDRLARILGVQDGQPGTQQLAGKVSFDGELTAAGARSSGELRVSVAGARVGPVQGVSARLTAKLDNRAFTGDLSTYVHGVGGVGAAWKTTLDGPPERLASWQGAAGELSANWEQLKLGGLEQLVRVALPPSQRAQLPALAGTSYGALLVTRAARAPLPSAEVVLGTRGLVVAQSATTPVKERFDSFDVRLRGAVDGQHRQAELRADLVDLEWRTDGAKGSERDADSEGPLLRLRATALDRGRSFAPRDVEATLTAEVVHRTLDKLPRELRLRAPWLANFRGVLDGNVRVEHALGALFPTLTQPAVRFELSLRDKKSTQKRRLEVIDLDAHATGEWKDGRLGAALELARGGRTVAATKLEADTAPQLQTAAVSRPTRLDLRVALDQLPIEAFPTVAARDLSGHVAGAVQLHVDPKARSAWAALGSKDIGLRRHPLGTVAVTLNADDTKLNGSLRLDSTLPAEDGTKARNDGKPRSEANKPRDESKADDPDKCIAPPCFLDLSLASTVDWRGFIPTVDQRAPIDARFFAQRYPVASIDPLLPDAIAELRGRLDGGLELTIEPPVEGKPRPFDLRGGLRLTSGVLRPASLATGFKELRIDTTVTTSRQRDVTIELNRNFEGRAVANDAPLRLTKGRVTLTDLESLKGELHASLGEQPMIVDGVNIGMVSAQADASIEGTTSGMQVRIEIPKAIVRLPRSATRTSVQSLIDNPDVAVLQPSRKPVGERTADALPISIAIALGKGVRLERTPFELPLGGQVTAELRDEVSVGGAIELEPGGRLPLMGKVFVIQYGRLTFDTGDSSNPSIEVVAYWENKDAEHDATIFVEVRGTARKARLLLRSSPPLSESQILSLLAGGSTDQGSVVVGAASALGVDAIFENTPLRQLQVRVDQSDGVPTYIASVRLSDTVWLEGKYQRRDPNKQQTTGKNDNVALAVDWRFLREWSWRLEGGNANAGTDVLWTYRY